MLDPDAMEIGATRGKTHDDVLTQTLGREDGLRVATGVTQWKGPVVEGGDGGERGGAGGGEREREGEAALDVDADVVEKEKAASAEAGDVHQEITDKKIERHGDVGGKK